MCSRKRHAIALLIAAVLCVDLAGIDCGGPQASGQAGPDCLCCSAVDLAVQPPVLCKPTNGSRLAAIAATDLAAGAVRPPYHPPLS